MKKAVSIFITKISLLLLVLILFQGCEVIGGIFKAGVWTGIVLVALVIAVIIFIITRISKK